MTDVDVFERTRGTQPAAERLIVPVGAVVLTTFFALLYALRGGITLIDVGADPRWSWQVGWSLAMWWTCLPFLPPLAWLVRRYPVGGLHGWRNASVLLIGVLAAALLRHFALSWVVVAVTGESGAPAGATARVLTYFTVFLVMVALLHAAYYYRAERARGVREAELARGLAEARLAALRTQLQPHFVFNVLNAATTLVHADPMAADRMLTRFAALLRVVLQEGAEEHALDREIDLLAQYVELMQLRFGDRIAVEWAVADDLGRARVPFLALQPLVENAYEHGLGGREHGGRIRISAARHGDTLHLSVEDDGAGLSSLAPVDTGIGLRNTRDRLVHLYGTRASLNLESVSSGGARALMSLPFVESPSA